MTEIEEEVYNYTMALYKDAEKVIKANKEKQRKQIEEVNNELEEYHSIGTVEQFRCLYEKNNPKKPINVKGLKYSCPNCEATYDKNNELKPYCSSCGQAINIEEMD